MEGKNIKVYGTLINQTLNTNSSMRDSQHNDLIAVAYQLYDERFNPRKGSGTNFAVTAIDRYQDIINKRLTAIYFDDKGTGNTSDDVTYIDSKLNVAGDSVFEGPVTFNNNVNITGNINLNIGLNDLNDVTLSTMAVGQVLRYDGSKWVNAKLSLSDILMPAASNGLVLKFNGTEWVAGNDAGGVSRLSELQDVNISNPDNGAKLVYDAASGKWIALGSGASGAVDISLGELNNVTEQNKQNSSVLIYDNTGGTWKPAMFGNSATTTYTQLTVTFNKVITREAVGYGGMNLNDTDTMQDKLYPNANNVYLYSTSQAFTIPSGYTISSITPNSQFGSSNWNVKVYATDLPKAKIANRSNVPYSINGHSKTFNVLSIMSGEYNVKSSDIASAQTTTSTSGRFSTVKPLNSNGDLYAYTVESSARSIYRFNGADNSGIFAGVKIYTNGEIVDLDSTENCGGFVLNDGTQTTYERVTSSTNSATYDNYLTTRYATLTWTVDNSYNWSVVMTSISRDECLRNMYASGTTSPIQINAGVITFQFIANKDITYPDSFQATVTLAKTEAQNASIGGLSITEGDCITTVNSGWNYAGVAVSANDAQNIISCVVSAMPKSGAVNGNGVALLPTIASLSYNAAMGGYFTTIDDPDKYTSLEYKYISYNT